MGNIKSLESIELTEIVDKLSPFLKEVRKRILTTIIIFAAASIVGLIFYGEIVRFLIDIFNLEGVNIVFTSPFQFINLAFSTALSVGLVVVMPFLVFQILYFLRPALMKKEFRTVTRFIPYSLILFLVGFSFGLIVMQWHIEIFLIKSVELGIGNVLDVSRLLSTILLTSTIMGIAFQFPIVLLLLLRIGLVNRKQLSSKRMWIYLGSFFFAILLPLDSIIADVLLALPLVFLFEFTLILDRYFERKRNKAQAQKQ